MNTKKLKGGLKNNKPYNRWRARQSLSYFNKTIKLTMIKKHRNNAFQIQPRPLPSEKVETPDETKEVTVKKPKIGFKGFDKDLKCRGYQFEVGKVHTLPEKKNPLLCSKDGFHYCNSLHQVFSFYNNDDSRYCVIEVLGDFTDDNEKSISTSIKILQEIAPDKIKAVRDKMEIFEYEKSINLPTIRKIQTHNPYLHVGGSAALYLYGIKLSRIEEGSGQPSDIDMVSPFYHFLNGDEKDVVEQSKSKNSGNDFHEGFYFNKIGVDMRIDNMQKYNIIEYDGFKYKVSQFEVILQAKLNYAMQGNEKHQKDIAEICGVKKKETQKPKQAKASENDDLFDIF